MPSLSPDLLTRLRAALSRCLQLRDDATLRTLFADARISPWANELSNALRASDRIGFIIDTLGDRTHADYHENALILFLYTLRDTVDSRDTLHGELDALACDLAASFGVVARHSGSGEMLPDMLPRRESFFGREKEIAKALEALGPEDRSWGLVIDGIGGIGKTALAVELAYRCLEEGRFEVCLFATAKTTRLEPSGERPLPDNIPVLDTLMSQLAHALGATGVAQSVGAEKHKGLLAFLRSYASPVRRVLIILDNLETLLPDEQVAAAEWMRTLPTPCKGIITSRRRTGDGAVWLRLDRLEWGAARQLIAEEIRRSDTLARILTPAGETRWQELYDATGGSPLALRWLLGLMRARSLSIERAVSLMRDAESDAPLYQFIYHEARQEMGADDWQLLSALALFAASASFDALTALTGLTRLALESAVERLSAYALVDVLGPDGPYTLHPLTHSLALAELKQQADGGAALRRTFGQYWVEYAETYSGHGRHTYQTYDRLDAEWPNLEAAASELYALTGLPGALVDNDAGKMFNDLVSALRYFLWFWGYWDEWLHIVKQGYDVAVSYADWSKAGLRAYDLAWIYCHRAEITSADFWVSRCADVWERGSSWREHAAIIYLHGLVERQGGHCKEAAQLLEKALAASQTRNAKAEQAIALDELGAVALAQNDDRAATAYYQEALTIAKELEHKEEQAVCLKSLGLIALRGDNLATARSLLEHAFSLAREVRRADLIASILEGLAPIPVNENSREAITIAPSSLIGGLYETGYRAVLVRHGCGRRHLQSGAV